MQSKTKQTTRNTAKQNYPTDLTDLNLYCIKGALALVVLVSFSGYVC